MKEREKAKKEDQRLQGLRGPGQVGWRSKLSAFSHSVARIKEVLIKLSPADLRDFMSQCGKEKRFSTSPEQLAVIAYKKCDFSHKILLCPLEMSLHQKNTACF